MLFFDRGVPWADIQETCRHAGTQEPCFRRFNFNLAHDPQRSMKKSLKNPLTPADSRGSAKPTPSSNSNSSSNSTNNKKKNKNIILNKNLSPLSLFVLLRSFFPEKKAACFFTPWRSRVGILCHVKLTMPC